MRLQLLVVSLAAVAAPALSQAGDGQPFRVFFDWGKPELTRDAVGILDEAIASYQRTHPGQVLVAGHTDRSGSTRVNLAASKRRAETVSAYLVAHGVPATAIILTAYGESQPIVPTEDGVREVQNRRVEISFSDKR